MPRRKTKRFRNTGRTSWREQYAERHADPAWLRRAAQSQRGLAVEFRRSASKNVFTTESAEEEERRAVHAEQLAARYDALAELLEKPEGEEVELRCASCDYSLVAEGTHAARAAAFKAMAVHDYQTHARTS